MKRTNFYNIHKKLGAKLVEFAGFEMPIQYSSIIAEHKTVRNSVGVFDVSHMGEVFVKGEKALDFVQHIAVNDTSKLQTGRVQYTAMCYEDGGIVDDLLVYKIADDEFLLVINASIQPWRAATSHSTKIPMSKIYRRAMTSAFCLLIRFR